MLLGFFIKAFNIRGKKIYGPVNHAVLYYYTYVHQSMVFIRCSVQHYSILKNWRWTAKLLVYQVAS